VTRYSGRGKESVVVPLDAGARAPNALLGQFVRQVRGNLASVRKAISKSVKGSPPIEELIVSLEFDWELSSAGYPDLLVWLNAPLAKRVEKLTVEALRQGKRDDRGWYEPPKNLDRAFQALEKESARYMAAHALAQALLSKQPLRLGQPDDDHEVVAWPEDDGDDDDE
jgi:hypothetical protein